jgi:hypothetical protein
MIFPELGPQYYGEQHKEILSMMEARYAESITINQAFWGDGDTCTRAEAGDTTLWNNLYGNLPSQSNNRRNLLNFNHIRPIVNTISGHQRRNRKSIIATPIENADNETSDQLTKVLFWINQQEAYLETISDAFQGALITGMNLLHVWMDYRNDPISGNIRIDNCAYNSFLIDPYFRKSDLSDCRYVWKRSFLSKRDAISLLPAYTEEIMGLVANQGNARDGKFQFLPESYTWNYNDLLTYDEFYYRDYRSQQMLVDTQTGETLEWRSQDKERLKAFLRAYPQITVTESQVQTTRLAIVVQNKVIYEGPQPSGLDQYPFIPVIGYYRPEMEYFNLRIQGVVHGLIPAQYLYNRRKIIELDILESQVTSGWIYKENALVNPLDVYQQVGQGKGIALKEEAQMTDVQQIQSPVIPPTTIELSRILAEEINKISGVSEEMQGFDNKDTLSGYHAMLKQSASTTTLQPLFDQLDRSMKLLGRSLIDLIQVNFTPGKVQKILEGQQPTDQFYNKAFGKYDATVEEGLNTSTQRQMEFQQLLYLRTEAGMQIPDETIIEAATLQGKNKLIESLKQNQQQQAQAQQMQMQAALEEQQARTKLAEARATADEGLGVERLSRVEENRALAVERRAAAVKDQEQGLLDFVKALKEIDDIDLNHVHKLVTLSQMMQKHEKDMATSLENTEAKPKPEMPQQQQI